MTDSRWMIYGATGYTGSLVAEEAVRRGHRPLLAGRSGDKVHALADRLGCEAKVFSLNDPAEIVRHLTGVDLVYHAAGPYTMTARPMLDACLVSGTHYLDISGEIATYELAFSKNAAAQQRGILIAPGMGFDVISDCLIAHVANQLPDADTLDVGIRAIGNASAGTTKSMMEIIAGGGLVRREGELVPYQLGRDARTVRFSVGWRTAVPIPWGDLSTAYRTTGIPNITTYFVLNRNLIALMQAAPLGVSLLRIKPLRRAIQQVVGWTVDGPSEQVRQTARASLWARVTTSAGDKVEAWLDTGEAYQFTVVAGVRAVERVLSGPPTGALTPSQVLGADFPQEIDGVVRYDSLPG